MRWGDFLGKSSRRGSSSVNPCILVALVVGVQLGFVLQRASLLPTLKAKQRGLESSHVFEDSQGNGGKQAGEEHNLDDHGTFGEQVLARLDSQEKALEELASVAGIAADVRSKLEEWEMLVDSQEGSTLVRRGSQSPRLPKTTKPGACRRQQDTGRQGKLVWMPTPGRFLLVMCSGGQLSNRLACIRQHMLDAALLNRTLILPSTGVDYDFENLIDLQQPRICFGNSTFLTLHQYRKTKQGRQGPLHVDKFICHVHKYQQPSLCAGLAARYMSLGITFGETIVPLLRTPGPWYKYPRDQFVELFHFPDAPVVAFGNMFGAGGRELKFVGSLPLAVSPACRYFLGPAKPIAQAAAGFVNSYTGSTFMAVHLRRGDFFQHCMRGAKNSNANKSHPCFFPIRQVAACLSRRLDENPELDTIFLATNGNDLEVSLLGQLLSASHGRQIPLLRLPSIAGAPWAQQLNQMNLHEDPDVIALVEKTVCVLSSVFFGTWGSTFSGDIFRVRDWWFTRSCSDACFCSLSESADTVPFERWQLG